MVRYLTTSTAINCCHSCPPRPYYAHLTSVSWSVILTSTTGTTSCSWAALGRPMPTAAAARHSNAPYAQAQAW